MRKEVKVGLFAFIVLIALYWGINFLRGRDIFSLSHTYYALYEQVNGLQKSSAVTAKGVKIGVVENIIYDPAKSDKVTLALSIDSKYHIPENSQARIYSSGIMEGKAIEIALGNSPLYLNDRDTLHSFVDPGLLETAGLELEALTAKLSQTADSATKLLTTITSLLEDNRPDIDGTLANINKLSETLAAEGATLHRTLDNIEKFSGSLSKNTDNIDTTLGNLNTLTTSLARVDIQRLDNSLAQLDSMLTNMRNGEGTLGKMVANDSLYNNLAQASADLAILLQDIKTNPQRYVTISVFGNKNR
jgi:phospholipid/cholesterol/gamma-HCH transport system substrate-binding protein